MTTYKGIRGLTIQTVAGDPSPLTAGDIWYSNTTRKIRGAKLVGSWATATSIPETKNGAAGFGTQTAAAVAGGSPNLDSSFKYDGSSWTASGDLDTGRNRLGGSGTQTAGIVFGGYQSPIASIIALTETYDGSSWSEVADLTTARGYTTGSTAGTQTATLCFGGGPPTPAGVASETWNGTSWTEGNNLNTNRHYLAGSGTSTDALCMGGAGSPSYLAVTEKYNGTSWTETGDFPAGINRGAGAFGATSSASIYAGGRATDGGSAQSTSFEFDGSSWSALPAINTARITGYGAGTTSAGLIMGGEASSAVEEWDKSVAVSSFTSS